MKRRHQESDEDADRDEDGDEEDRVPLPIIDHERRLKFKQKYRNKYHRLVAASLIGS
jgi:hypothetical protein